MKYPKNKNLYSNLNNCSIVYKYIFLMKFILISKLYIDIYNDFILHDYD